MSAPDQINLTEYLNRSISCDCGRKHSVQIKNILIEENALHSLPALLHSYKVQKSFVLYDATTYSVAGDMVTSAMNQSNLPFASYVLSSAEPVPDEKTVGEILIHYDRSCDFIIAVGSGTMNDLCRFISYKLGIPYMVIATAPSVDGFASNVAPLIVNHMKTTYEAHVPYAIIGDTRILMDAPMKMIAAGIGDILGKYTCLCDWKIAHIVTDEYHCGVIEAMVRQSLEIVVTSIESAKQRNLAAVKNIMEALVLSGIAMSFAGNSRPASGSEHHLSHYWEMIFLFQGKQPALHGTKVGIGTVAVIKAYELLMAKDIDFRQAETEAKNYSSNAWEAFMKQAYLEASDSVIALERETGKNEPSKVITRIKLLEQNWDRMKKASESLPPADQIRSLLTSLGAPGDPMSVGIDKETFVNSFLAAKELRNRFGLLQILFDLGLAEEIAGQVWEYFQA